MERKILKSYKSLPPVPPSFPPEINGVPADFSPGDFLSLNCSTYNVSWLQSNVRAPTVVFLYLLLQSSVPPHLHWVLNHEEVTDFGLERRYPSTSTTYLARLDITTLYITTMGLQFWVKRKHFMDGKVSSGIFLIVFRLSKFIFSAGCVL